MYNIKDILTMNDNQKFIIVNKAKYNNKNYYLMINYNDENDWLIVYEENNLLKEEMNNDIIPKIINLFKIDINMFK